MERSFHADNDNQIRVHLSTMTCATQSISLKAPTLLILIGCHCFMVYQLERKCSENDSVSYLRCGMDFAIL